MRSKGKKRKFSLFMVFVLLFSLLASSLVVMAETVDADLQMSAVDTPSEEPTTQEPLLEERKVEEPLPQQLKEEMPIQEPKVEEPILEEPKEEISIEEQKIGKPVLVESEKSIHEANPIEEPAEDLEEEKIDEGPMLDNMPTTPHPSNPTPITRFAAGSLGSALTLRTGFRMMSTIPQLQPGEVVTSKTATPVEGMVNTWDITVRVEGRDNNIVETTDVVLVIDRSGSMADNNRMSNAKIAANKFINTMIPDDPNLRIAIVSFSSDYQGAQLVTVNSNFTRDINQLKSSVNSLVALGGTHTQAGIIQGRALLNGSLADNKFMVLLSDGQPTYSYEPTNWTVVLRNPNRTNNRDQYTAIYDGNYNTASIVGTGNALTQSINQSVEGRYITKYINNGGAAIRAGVDARSGIEGLFTVAVQAGTTGTPILADIASPGMAYSTENPEELQEIYDRIGTQIATQYAIRNAVITDEMGDGFSLINGTILTTEGTTAVAGATDTNNQTIIWTIDPAITTLVEGSQDVRYAEMTYRVEINPDILTASVATPGTTPEHDLFKTNKLTTLNYLDINDTNQAKSITSPEVDPVLLKIKKVLKDELGNVVNSDSRIFNVQITNGESGFNHTENLVVGADYAWLTTLRQEGTYNVTEISITGDGITDLDQFEVSYNIDGEEKTSFVVNHNSDGTPRGDVVIGVTNKAKGVDVAVRKEVTGNFGDLSREFTFTVIVNGDEENPITFDLSHGETNVLNNLPADAVLTLMEDSGDYDIIVKVGATEIDPSTAGFYTIDLSDYDSEITITVTNKKDIVIDAGISLDSLPYVLILVFAVVGLIAMVIRKRNIHN